MSTSATTLDYHRFFIMQDSAANPAFGVVLEGGNCICCGGYTQTQLAGYWTHPQCARQVAEYVKLAEFEIPLIKQNILFSTKEYFEGAICSLGYDQAKFDAIHKEVTEKAWKVFKEKHPLPWLSVANEKKEQP
jgi:hypothetical protein